MNYTLGPWLLRRSDKDPHCVVIHEQDDNPIATAWNLGRQNDEPGRERVDANARLIAAAPDLLAIARRVHAECGPVRKRESDWPVYFMECPCCKKTSKSESEPIPHPPDCLWLAADAMKKEGII